MFRELSDIKVLRKRLGLTQCQLSNRAGVSQSLIAKVEAGKIDPTYTKAKKIFDTLEEISTSSKMKASEIMNSKVVYARPTEKITHVIAEMKHFGISQLPVAEGNELVGFVSDNIILNALLEGKKHIVEDIMAERPPTVSKDTDIDVISGLLKYFPMITVFDKHKMVGVITKSDLIERL